MSSTEIDTMRLVDGTPPHHFRFNEDHPSGTIFDRNAEAIRVADSVADLYPFLDQF